MGSALACGGTAAELAGIGCVQHRAASDLLPQKPPLQHLPLHLQNFNTPKGL